MGNNNNDGLVVTDAPITDGLVVTDAPITDAPITDGPVTDAVIEMGNNDNDDGDNNKKRKRDNDQTNKRHLRLRDDSNTLANLHLLSSYTSSKKGGSRKHKRNVIKNIKQSVTR
jgi:hypothetical protein